MFTLDTMDVFTLTIIPVLGRLRPCTTVLVAGFITHAICPLAHVASFQVIEMASSHITVMYHLLQSSRRTLSYSSSLQSSISIHELPEICLLSMHVHS